MAFFLGRTNISSVYSSRHSVHRIRGDDLYLHWYRAVQNVFSVLLFSLHCKCFYVASETSGDWWSGGSGHRWGLGIPAQHAPTCLYVLLFQQQIFFPVTCRRNCKSRAVNAERILLFIITYWACWKSFRWSYVTWWCPCRVSVRMEQLLSHWTDFQEIWYLSIFRKSVEKIKVALK